VVAVASLMGSVGCHCQGLLYVYHMSVAMHQFGWHLFQSAGFIFEFF
jgi:hypothetical protein